MDLTVQSTGDATLTVTHTVLDGRGRAVSSATTIEHVELSVGADRLTQSADCVV